MREGAAKMKCGGSEESEESEEAEPEEQKVMSVCKEFRDAPMASSEENSAR
jgi:hypothetical protein